jgi:hypothetical protein
MEEDDSMPRPVDSSDKASDEELKSSESFYVVYKVKVHPITGPEGPRGGVEV